MPAVSPSRQWPRGPTNLLHKAAFVGSPERLVALLLSKGSIDIDQADPDGWTPLMAASFKGHSPIVRILLDKGANLSIAGDTGLGALHLAAQEGHLAVSKMLVEAGSELEAKNSEGDTPLQMAAQDGHSKVVDALIEAGANPNSRSLTGATPLYVAAQEGHLDAVKRLLRAKANPRLAMADRQLGDTTVPLDLAAQNGHLGVVRELVQQVGIEGCGGATRGVEALRLAAMNEHVEILAVLTDAGVVDNGIILANAAARGSALTVKLMLQQWRGDEAAYANIRDTNGETPLLCGVGLFARGSRSPSPRVVRLLVDAGADTTSTARVTGDQGELVFSGKPLAVVSRNLREKKVGEENATEQQLHRLEGIRRLLLRVEAVRAVSFLWPFGNPSIGSAAKGTSRKVAASASVRMMLPILRRRARRPSVLLANLFRMAEKA